MNNESVDVPKNEKGKVHTPEKKDVLGIYGELIRNN